MQKKFFYLTTARGCLFIIVPLLLHRGFFRGASLYLFNTAWHDLNLISDAPIFFGAIIFGILSLGFFFWCFTGTMWIRPGKWIAAKVSKAFNAPYKPPRR